MNNFDLRKYLAEGKLLKEELVYQFSEYDYDITEEEGYQEDVITRIKEELPTVDHEEIMKMIRSIEDYYYDEARKENKRGEEYPSVSSEDFAGEVIWNLEELGLAENKLLKEEVMVDTTVMVDPNNTLMSNASDEEIDYIKANLTNVPKMEIEEFMRKYDEYFDRFYGEGDPLDLQIKALQIHIDKGVLTREEAIEALAMLQGQDVEDYDDMF